MQTSPVKISLIAEFSTQLVQSVPAKIASIGNIFKHLKHYLGIACSGLFLAL
jgi:hypothetical protein